MVWYLVPIWELLDECCFFLSKDSFVKERNKFEAVLFKIVASFYLKNHLLKRGTNLKLLFLFI